MERKGGAQRGRSREELDGLKGGERRRNKGEGNKDEQGQKNTGGDEDNGTVRHLEWVEPS